MKITKTMLKQVIKEELQKTLKEVTFGDDNDPVAGLYHETVGYLKKLVSSGKIEQEDESYDFKQMFEYFEAANELVADDRGDELQEYIQELISNMKTKRFVHNLKILNVLIRNR
tara:strand:+ start:203 stop:544 length:342 start_codon:yes stop_codon:yes gene_type:complete